MAVAEPILLLNASHEPKSFAAVVLAIQVVGGDRGLRVRAAAGPHAGLASRPARARGRGARPRAGLIRAPRPGWGGIVACSGLSSRSAGGRLGERAHERLDDRRVELAAGAASQLVQRLERVRPRGRYGRSLVIAW